MSELAKRVAVAAVGIPVVLVLLWLGGWYLAVGLALFAGAGARELYRMAHRVSPFPWLGAATAAALVLAAAWRPTFATFAPWALGLVGALSAACAGAAIFTRKSEAQPLSALSVTVFGALYTGLALSVVPLLHALPIQRGWPGDRGAAFAGLLVLALPLATTWVGDASAYFAGSAWGKSKLAPSISPNKSWVGFWAALIGAASAAVIWFFVAAPMLPGWSLGLPVVIPIGVVLGGGAVIGDLFESLLKREAGVKDSGAFFPGHGGILDRLDSLLVTLPLAYVALVVFGG